MEYLRILLQNELAKRCQRNPRYSLRAFAKSLDTSHTVLSLVLSGKRSISKKLREKIREELGLTHPEETPVQQITIDAFAIISDWYHYAILSLLEIPESTINPVWISKKLGITALEAKLAVERLKRLELIEYKNDRWHQTGVPIRFDNTISNSTIKNFHKQLLSKAVESLENDPKNLRDFSSMTMAIDPDHLPFAFEEIKKFRRELTQKLEKLGRPKEVYNLTIQLYPISKNGDEK
ncbi:MAG: hypothetical protein A4S09_01245 [Proteobacteria bacterium SG_bin7]|nr:MAG: hypothetical protein A4S09_01245 [Proteobacteria bacterium SG_bin7]